MAVWGFAAHQHVWLYQSVGGLCDMCQLAHFWWIYSAVSLGYHSNFKKSVAFHDRSGGLVCEILRVQFPVESNL